MVLFFLFLEIVQVFVNVQQHSFEFGFGNRVKSVNLLLAQVCIITASRTYICVDKLAL